MRFFLLTLLIRKRKETVYYCHIQQGKLFLRRKIDVENHMFRQSKLHLFSPANFWPTLLCFYSYLAFLFLFQVLYPYGSQHGDHMTKSNETIPFTLTENMFLFGKMRKELFVSRGFYSLSFTLSFCCIDERTNQQLIKQTNKYKEIFF